MDRLGWILLLACGVWLLSWLQPLDSTDGRDARSGMRLRVDYGTGCQYLESTWGSLTPRLDEAGKPMCGGAH